MKAKTKKLVFFIGAIFVGIIFLTSYAAFSNNAGNTSTTTVKAAPQPTIFATGYANATITGYVQVANVKLINSTNSTLNNLDTLMSKLEANGSINNYIYTNNSYEVYSSSLSAYALKKYLYATLNSSNSVTVGSTADIMLPASISLYYSNSSPPVSVPLSNRNYTLYLNNVRSIGSTLNVSLSALITEKGMLYNNQLRISLSSAEAATGYANALITGYAQTARIRPLNSSNSIISTITALMSELEANGSIGNYIYTNNSYEVYNSALSAYALQSLLHADLNSSNSVTVGSTANIMLPSHINFYYLNSNSPVDVSFSNRNHTLYLGSVRSIGSTINVSVSALLTQNGMPYNSKLGITLK